jgi:O-antigen/teichoic acid export membrane protein
VTTISILARLKADSIFGQILGAGAATLVIKAVSAAFSYLMFVVLANLLPTGEFGRFAFGFSLAITLGTVAGLGLATAVLRFLPQYEASGEAALSGGFLRWSTSVTAWLSVSVAVATILLSLLIEHFVEGLGLGYVRAAAVLVPLFAAAELAANTLRANGHTFAALSPRDIIWRALVPLSAAALAWFGISLTGAEALLLSAIIIAIILAVQIALAVRVLPVQFRNPAPRYDRSRWIAAALPMWGAATLYALVQQFDVVVLGVFLSPEESGPYFAALRTAALLNLLLIAGNMASAPLIARCYHSGDHDGLKRLIHLLTPGIALPTLAGFGIIALLGPFLLGLFDPGFASAYPLLLILALGFTFDAISGPTGYILQMIGKERLYLAIMACSYAATLALQCVLIPIYGPVGAAIPTAFGILAANICIIVAVKRAIGIDPSIFGVTARWIRK